MTDATAPYNMVNDSTMMLLLILNIVSIAYVVIMNGASIAERIKGLFYYRRNATPFNDRTHITKICNILLNIQTVFYLSLTAMLVLQKNSLLEINGKSLSIAGVFALFFATFILLKRLAYGLVNSILFSRREVEEWDELYSFTTKLLGFTITPAAAVMIFIPALPTIYVYFYIFLTLLLFVCTKTNGLFRIIFTKNRNYLDIFLYLCALEFLPMAMAWKFILELSEFITIKI